MDGFCHMPSYSKKILASATALVDFYGGEVKPRRWDHSRTQAIQNAAKRMKSDGLAYAELKASVRNYLDWCTRQNYSESYRKNVGNFFGRDAICLEYLPGVYEPLPARELTPHQRRQQRIVELRRIRDEGRAQ